MGAPSVVLGAGCRAFPGRQGVTGVDICAVSWSRFQGIALRMVVPYRTSLFAGNNYVRVLEKVKQKKQVK